MATVKVLKPFIDIHTNIRHQVDEVYEATDERISEIKSVDEELIQVIDHKRSRKKGSE